ncbi:MAG: aminoacyl-histidine dipeptidase [Ruminococcaceae bacterium]|nr:aminoacyl-histidine dipeptidase [Oscillospiraceae bacterium]
MISEGFAYPCLMRYFEEISAIPRGSYHEEQISDYLERFAKERGLSYERDAQGTVLIRKAATPQKEGCAPILLQGHTDMVCEKNEGVAHDFSRDPLQLYVQDGWLRAKGTTLGADDGVAVAAMLAILDGAAEEHPPLECLFTVSEEVGLDGVKAFDLSHIHARRMINMDSADENGIIVGCAGGLRSSMVIPVERETCDLPQFLVKLTGLAGGHSGEDINRGRENSCKVMGRILWALQKADPALHLVSLKGGSKDNAIPREAEAVIAAADENALRLALTAVTQEIIEELGKDDRAFSACLSSADSKLPVMTQADTAKLLFLLSTVANGVFAVNHELNGLVEFSRNLGIVESGEQEVKLVFSSRSARDSQIDRSAAELDAYAEQLGGTVRHYNRYPGWVYAEQSPLREAYIAAYRSVYGRKPKQEVIHAGLECGIVKEAIPDMDILSCGPVVLNLHSPDEALELSSFERFFTVILNFLQS